MSADRPRAEQTVVIWAAQKLGVPPDEIDYVKFEHEDAYGNDQGTWWPERNVAVVHYHGASPAEIPMDDGVEGFHDLLREILDANP